jgi:hypothetical protein
MIHPSENKLIRNNMTRDIIKFDYNYIDDNLSELHKNMRLLFFNCNDKRDFIKTNFMKLIYTLCNKFNFVDDTELNAIYVSCIVYGYIYDCINDIIGIISLIISINEIGKNINNKIDKNILYNQTNNYIIYLYSVYKSIKKIYNNHDIFNINIYIGIDNTNKTNKNNKSSDIKVYTHRFDDDIKEFIDFKNNIINKKLNYGDFLSNNPKIIKKMNNLIKLDNRNDNLSVNNDDYKDNKILNYHQNIKNIDLFCKSNNFNVDIIKLFFKYY